MLGQTLELARCGRGVGLTFQMHSPKLGGGLCTLWWCGPDAEPRGRRWSTDVEMAAVFPTEAKAVDAFAAAGPLATSSPHPSSTCSPTWPCDDDRHLRSVLPHHRGNGHRRRRPGRQVVPELPAEARSSGGHPGRHRRPIPPAR